MFIPLALLTAIRLSLRDRCCYAEEFLANPSVVWETETVCPTTPTYAGSVKSKRNANPGTPIPLSDQDKMEIVNEHNKYRGQVSPPAANMRYMIYNEDVAYAAQLWANGCQFRHGRPQGSKFQKLVGQNIYKGPSGSYSFYMRLWHNEVRDFDMKSQQCNATMCGHYLQMVWAESFLIGCGQSHCRGKRRSYNLFVCHYYKAFESFHPYKVGRPCSMCDAEAGGFCYNNTCVSKEDCEREGWPCECNLKCHNCGILDESTCTCKCPPGWDYQDCSQNCSDSSDYCGKEDGFEGWVGCEMLEDGYVKTHYCRKMCETCEVITEGNKEKTCCGGELCDKGYVLDNSNCNCRRLCPGPECYFTYEDNGVAYRVTNSLLTVIIAGIYALWQGQEPPKG